MYEYCSRNDVGVYYKINDDKFMINGVIVEEGDYEGETQNYISAVLCDGVGGQQEGYRAALMTLEKFKEVSKENLGIEEIMDKAKEANDLIRKIQKEENKEKETPQEDVNKKVIKKPSVKIKKSFVLALIAVVIVVITYAFISASIKVKKANNIQKSQEENEEVVKKTAPNFDFLESDYSKLKKIEEEEKEKTYRELVKTEIEEKKVDDSILGPNIKMEEYYTQLLQEEMQSRLSDIDYSIISKNNNIKAENLAGIKFTISSRTAAALPI